MPNNRAPISGQQKQAETTKRDLKKQTRHDILDTTLLLQNSSMLDFGVTGLVNFRGRLEPECRVSCACRFRPGAADTSEIVPIDGRVTLIEGLNVADL
jgi:hypothetical protein